MQSLETIYHLLSQEVSVRWSPKIGNKTRKRKTWTTANKRPNEGGKENAQEDEKGDARLSGVQQGSTLRLEQVRGSSRRWWTWVPALGGRAWQGRGAGGDSAPGGCWLSLRSSPWGPAARSLPVYLWRLPGRCPVPPTEPRVFSSHIIPCDDNVSAWWNWWSCWKSVIRPLSPSRWILIPLICSPFQLRSNWK